MRDDIVLQIESLKKGFTRNTVNIQGQSRDERFYIIDDLSLRVSKGKITALIGGNGAGKTTLFNLITGFVEADGGKVLFRKGRKAEDLLNQKSDSIARRGIGRMFQDNHILPGLSVLDNMLIADGTNFGENPFLLPFRVGKIRDIERQRMEKACKIFADLFGTNNPYWENRSDLAGSLSYGQQRLLGLARLLMGNYVLLLLDEPTAGVNEAVIGQIQAIIKSLVAERNLSVFLIEHNMKVVLELADFCLFMSHGKIAAFGGPSEIIGNDEVQRTYLGL